MAEMDEDGSGEVDFDEFSAWFMKDKEKHTNIPPTPHFKGVMDDDGVDRRDEWASDDEEEDEDMFLNTQPSIKPQAASTKCHQHDPASGLQSTRDTSIA